MSANPNWGEMVTSTLTLRRKKVADTLSRNNILYYELRRRGRMKPADGGRSISQPLLIGEENSNFQWYGGRDPLNIEGQEVLTSAEFPWKQYACGVSISGLEMLQNSGKSQQISIMSSRIEHAEKTIMNQMHESAHGDGTRFAGREFGGLQLMVSTSAGATVGGIDSSTYDWWDNFRATTGGVSVNTIYADMLDLHLKLRRGMDKPSLALSDNTYFSAFAQSLQAQQRFQDGGLARAGFENLMFLNCPVVPDGGQGGYAPVGMRFLNMSTICLTMHKKRNNVVLTGAAKRPINEDSETVIIAGMGNFTIDNRKLNGSLSD